MEILQGEQFKRYIGGDGIDFDLCDQIVLKIYSKTTDNTLLFVKTEDLINYPTASLLLKSDDVNYKIMITLSEDMTKSLSAGIYFIEAKRNQDDFIYKGVTEFLTVKKSMIL